MRQFAVIGLGRFGSAVAKSLAKKGYQVLAIDISEQKTQAIADDVTQAVCLDGTDEKAFRNVGIENVDAAIVGMGSNLEASILITLNLKEMGIKEIVCKAVSEDHKKVLEKIGATKVIQPEKEMGIRLANSLVSTSVVEHINLSTDSSIVELMAPKDFIGKSLRGLEVRAKFGVTVIALKEKIPAASNGAEEEIVNIAPKAEDIVKKGSILVVLGSNKNIDKLKKEH